MENLLNINMEYRANCKCETPSIGVTIEKRGKYIMESSHCCFCGWPRSKVVFYSFLLQ